jgi:hypothetical protein
MTGEIFRERRISTGMKRQRRSVVLVVDNSSAHPKDAADDLQNVRLLFLPPNAMSLIQPCDMGIIRNLKAFYRRRIVKRVVSAIDSDKDSSASSLAKDVSVLEAMHMLRASWSEVTSATVANCFRKAGFCVAACTQDVPDTEECEDELLPPEDITPADFTRFVSIDESTECQPHRRRDLQRSPAHSRRRRR